MDDDVRAGEAGSALTTGREREMRRLEGVSWLLDNSIRVPGTQARFGLDAVLGLVPGIGDAAGAVLSAYVVVQAARLGAPVPSLLRMLLNVGVEAVVGAVPVVGDLFDAGWKANVRNVNLLRRELDRPGSTRRGSAGVVLAIGVALFLVLGAAAWLAFALLRAVAGVVT